MLVCYYSAFVKACIASFDSYLNCNDACIASFSSVSITDRITSSTAYIASFSSISNDCIGCSTRIDSSFACIASFSASATTCLLLFCFCRGL